jgi:hypothetical protein
MATLTERAQAAGIELLALSPKRGDFNEDLRHLGADGLRAALRVQFARKDVARFMAPVDEAGKGDDDRSCSGSASAHRLGRVVARDAPDQAKQSSQVFKA